MTAMLLGVGACVHAAPSADQVEYFEKTIRPLFVDRCYGCHSEQAEKVRGELRLDTPAGLLKGGKSGAVIVPGDPDASRLIKAVRYKDPDLQMPPKGKKLTDPQIASLEAWVKMGAPVPATSAGTVAAPSLDQARERHWAFQPVTKPDPPAVRNPSWVRTSIDNFVLAALEKNHLLPAPAADRRTLIRRVTYDLTGLPPTYEEVEAFTHDARPQAYSNLVDRLLASPHYGERWGRYWLDVARYADTKGYLAGGEERRYAFSYTYRDYVVQSFNEDKPYDQFIKEQIAADKMVQGDDKHALAALGFLTLGRRFLNNRHDIIDDRIDVVTRGTLGLTTTCARCHDHKFDPISTKDYYALHGIFASSEEPAELPLLSPLTDTPEYHDYLKQKAKIEAEIVEFKDREIAKFLDELRTQVGDYLLGARDAKGLAEGSKFDLFAGERKLNPVVLRRWMSDLETRAKNPDPIFAPWFDLATLTDFSKEAAPIFARWNTNGAVNPVVTKALTEKPVDSLGGVAQVYDRVFLAIRDEWNTAVANASKEKRSPPAALPDPEREALRQVLYADGTAVNLPRAEAERIQARRLGEGAAPLRNKIEALGWTHPGAPHRAMALVDRANPANSHVLLRGNPSTPGEEVPRRFLEVLNSAGCQPFTNGSGRWELACAIASTNNPLTARVYCNRVWLHHFGEGLVKTAGDFGVRTEEPVYHNLLDYLASSFMENGWSTKYLHRLILLSATYQQSSDASPTDSTVDPGNNLLSHMNRQRLDFEALRDTVLALAGKLDLSVGGLPADIESEPFSTRRTLYALVDRQNLPGVFRTFDFANPDTSNQGRFHTTVPQQALFLMNSPFVIQQARNLAQRGEVAKAGDPGEKIAALYRLMYQRDASGEEIKLGEQFIASQPDSGGKVSPLERYAQVLLVSNELIFLD